MWIVAGPNGAGKTTLATNRIGQRIPVINPDAIAEQLPYINGRLDERQAGATAIARRNALLDQGADFAVETTLTGNSTLRFMAAARQAGYKLTLVYIGLKDASLSLQRVIDRVKLGGHAVPVHAIERCFPVAMAKLSLAMALADRSYILDNSDRRRRLLTVVDEGRIKFLARDIPGWLNKALPDLGGALPS